MLLLKWKNETKGKMESSFFAKILGNFEKIMGKKVAKMLSGSDGEVGLTIVSDALIKRLNRDYRGKDSPTDVLSFAYLENEKMPVLKIQSVGDIFISLDTAKRQAKEKGHSLQHEMAILFTHGLLHLFGFTHENDKDEAEMEKWAKKILAT